MILYECDMCAAQHKETLKKYIVLMKLANESVHPYKSEGVHLCDRCLTELSDGLKEIMKPIEPAKEEKKEEA